MNHYICKIANEEEMNIKWDYEIALATGSIIGTQAALKIVSKIPLKVAKWLVTTILILLIVQVAWKFK